MAEGKITAQETLESDKIVQGFKDIDAAALKTLQTFSEIQRIGNVFKTQGQGAEIIRRNNTAQKDGLEIVRQRERLEKSLQSAIAKKNLAFSSANIELQKNRAETNLSNKAIREQVSLNSQLVGAYKKLSIEHSKARNTLKDYVAEGRRSNETQKQFNKRINDAQREFDKLDKRIIKADSSARQFNRNVGNYPKNIGAAISSLRSLAGALGVTIGLSAVVDFTKEAIALAREAKGVEFAFQELGTAGKNAFDSIRSSSRGLLSELEIQRSLVELDNFNISLEETDTLMEFLLVRATQTGRSVDSLRDSLVEGLSKESKLRIDNLGISTAELNSELEKTPNFVQAVANIAKREVAEAGDILDKAANSTEAWRASWENLSLAFGQAFDAFAGSDAVLSVLDEFTVTQKALNADWENGGGILGRLNVIMNQVTKSGREENRRIVEESENRRENARAIEEETRALVARGGVVGPVQEGETNGTGGFQTFQDFEKNKRLLSDINEELDKYNKQLQEGQFSTREEAKAIQEKIDALEKERESILGVSGVRKTARAIIDGTIGSYEKLIKKEEEFIKFQAQTNEEIERARDAIDKYRSAIKKLETGREELEKVAEVMKEFIGPTTIDGTQKLTKASEDLFDVFTGNGATARKEIEDFVAAAKELGQLEGFELGADAPAPEFIDISAELEYEADKKAFEENQKEKTRIQREQAEIRKGIATSVFDHFQELYGVDLSNFIQILEDKEFADLEASEKAFEIAEASQQALLSLNGALLNGTLDRLDIELEANRRKLDRVLDDENASAEQKKAAEERFRQEEAQIQRQQFEAEKKAAIAAVAINTAVAIIQAYAQLGPIGGTIAGVLISALSLVQLNEIKKQQPPQFFKGKDEKNNFEGLATWNERRPEVRVDKDGNVQFGKTKNELIYVSPEDIISPSYQDFEQQMQNPSSTIYKRVNSSLAQESAARTQMMVLNSNNTTDMSEVKKLRQDLRKFYNRPIHNHITIKNERKEYSL